MSEPVEGVEGGQADREDLVAQRALVSRLREAGAADTELRPAVKELESVLRSVIMEQGALVKRLRSDRTGPAHQEAVARLQALMAEFQEVSGRAENGEEMEGRASLGSGGKICWLLVSHI